MLADDALYSLAVLYNEQLKDSTSANQFLTTLIDKYPKADHTKKAKEYIKEIDQNLTASLNLNLNSLKNSTSSRDERVIYHGLRAYKRNNDIIQLKVELDASKRKNNLVTWAIEFVPAVEENDSPPRLILTLSNTTTAADTKPGHKYRDMGIVSKYVVDYSKRNSTVVIIDFDELAAYYAYFDKASSSIIIETTKNARKLTKGVITQGIESKEKNSTEFMAREFAIKMGLEVKTIVIDPGHGGKDPGAMHNGITEKDFVLGFSRQLGNELEKLGYEVKYTRDTDVFVSLAQRARMAEDLKGDLFISVHTNAAENKRLAGVETYYLDYTHAKSDHVALRENGGQIKGRMGQIDDAVAELALRAKLHESERLATFVQRNMYGYVNRKGFDVQNGGIKGNVFKVLDETSMPGILLEIGYISNSFDAKNLKNNAFVRSLAHGVAEGINAYSDDLNLAKNTKN